nr:hypothetical protein [Tanacetum cinerariifolium]
MIFDGLVKNVNNKVSKFLMYPRFLTMCLRMSQFGQLTHTHTYVVPFHTRKFFTTLRMNSPSFSGRIVPLFDTMLVQQGEGSGTPTEPHHTPSSKAQPPSPPTHSLPTLPPITTTSIPAVTPSETTPIRQYTRRARIAYLQRQHSELLAKFQAQEVEINMLKERVKLLEDRHGVAAQRSRDDTPIKGRSLDEGEATAKRISDDSDEMATVLTSIDAATVLARGIADVPTGSGSIPTASPLVNEVPTGSDVVPTASPVFATATVVARELEEQLEREDQRRSEQIAKDAEIVRIHAKKELQIMIDGLDRNNETVAKYLQEYHQFASELPIERRIELINDLVKYQDNYAKGYKFEEVEAKFNSVWKQIEDFVPMGLKEEAERFKRKGISFEQESAKKQKISEEVPEEVKSHDEVPKEKVKEMMQLVPIEEVYVEAIQVKHLIIDWKVYHEGQRSYWKITRLVKETLNNRPPTSDKKMELWVELSRLYESDHEDQPWTHTQNFMHAPVEWKLYDSCGVHHVTSKDKEIFMLVEKDYPLRKGLALMMISYKLQGRIVGNKMHKAFLLLGIEFPLAEEVPTASEESCHCQKKSEATAVKIALLLKVKKKLSVKVK